MRRRRQARTTAAAPIVGTDGRIRWAVNRPVADAPPRLLGTKKPAV